MKKRTAQLRKLLFPLLIFIMVTLLLRHVFLIGYIPSESMEPTLKRGSIIVGLRIHGQPQKGDIIVFSHNGKQLVKRIAAVEGEAVIHRGKPLIVPAGCFYVLGDNRDNSFDSRCWDEPFVLAEDVQSVLIWPNISP